ncbi:hemolysin family protein [Dokdonella sp.]|uniref:hemolysin family protein n=1 Tax=Dokdonella sp. TaxID=2291710 RepID=UPI001B0C6E89|nr:hemolysin family protein [Dokdonella sp.]MBO9662432.1 HlyC/CorC family transporter [Dokdonella sp.]
MLQNLLYVAAALLLVLLNGFFVAAEFALVKLRHTQAATIGDSHGWRGRVLVNVHSHLDAYLSACQLGITLASLGLGWIGEPAFAHLLEPLFVSFGIAPETTKVAALVIAFTLISYLHIVLGELAPKSLAIRRPEAMSLWTAAPLYAFYWMMYPAIWVLNASANWMLSRGGVEPVAHDEAHHYSRDELKLIVDAQRESRSGEEYSMMKYALDLPELVVGDVLRTRDQLASLREGMSRADVLAEFDRTRYSRYPWFDADGDHVVGILHMKDLLHAMAANGTVDDMKSLLRPPILLPLHTPVLDVLKRFRAGDTHLALGVEESGRVAGFFTLEDILEVLVGDIEDEHARGVAAPRSGTGEEATEEFVISGGTPIYKLERLLERDIAAPADVNSVGGLIIHRLERLPVEGETLSFDGFDLTVHTMQGARAKTIVVHPHENRSEETA